MKPRQRQWSWEFEAPPEALWPLVADTARFNEASGTPRYEIEEQPREDGSVLRMARLKLGPATLRWEDRPYEWVTNRAFTQQRRFFGGPFRTFGPVFRIEPAGAGGSRLSYSLVVEPRNALGWVILRLGFFRRTGAIIERLMREAAAFAAGKSARPFEHPAPSLPAGAAERARRLAGALVAEGHQDAALLADHLLGAAEVDVERLRPRALARRWARAPRPVIELCLAAAKAGLLELRWDLLCPRCRGAKASVPTLDQLPRGAHCPSCNIEYGRDFARNVEATFRPAPTIRAVGAGAYCLASPLATEHVRVQQILAPGETRRIEAALDPGPWRVRTLEPGAEAEHDHDGGAFPSIEVDHAALRLHVPEAAGHIVMANRGTTERTIVIETRAWTRDAVTAHEITTLQAFRDLFAAEALRPGDEVEIAQVTLMFTDLKASTALYARIGDAPAYAVVREHFAFLARTIRAHDGAIVKTIGDAVMAAFSDPADGVRAALAVQRDIAAFNRNSPAAALAIKLGLHAGPCIAVTLNDRLDYFGTTVNLAARLQQQSAGDDIVLSKTLAADPVVAPLLAGLERADETALVKGFEAPVGYWRMRPAGPGAA